MKKRTISWMVSLAFRALLVASEVVFATAKGFKSVEARTTPHPAITPPLAGAEAMRHRRKSLPLAVADKYHLKSQIAYRFSQATASLTLGGR